MTSDGEGAPPAVAYTRRRTTTAASSARRRRNAPHLRGGDGGGGDDGKGDGRNGWFARKAALWTDAQIRARLAGGDADADAGGAGFAMVGDVIQGCGDARAGEGVEGAGGARGPGAAPTAFDIMDAQDRADFMAPVRVGRGYRAREGGDDGDDDDGDDDDKPGPRPRRRHNAALRELAQVSGVGGGGPPAAADASVGQRLLRACGYRPRLGLALVPRPGRTGGTAGLEEELAGVPATREATWLASRGLRAVRPGTAVALPPPKADRHGLGHDPFQNAPEFRAFHAQRAARAQARGRGAEATRAGGGRGGDRYFTDDVAGGRRPWEAARGGGGDGGGGGGGDDGDEDGDDDGAGRARGGDARGGDVRHAAADRDYADLIGTRAADGFALRDEDDADVYGDAGGGGGDGDGGAYATEVQSPPPSEDEDDDADAAGPGAGPAGRARGDPGSGAPDAWGAWGAGGDRDAAARTAADGRPAPPGFRLGAARADARPKRSAGPLPPSGHVLRRHVFAEAVPAAGAADGTDAGLGLDLRRGRRAAPTVLPPPSAPPPPSDRLVARDGSALDFRAVRESMRSRFVPSAGAPEAPAPDGARDGGEGAPDVRATEWVQVAVTPWTPARLLCKRWGVPAPAGGGGGAAGRAEGREAAYFRRTVYEPAVRGRQGGAGAARGAGDGSAAFPPAGRPPRAAARTGEEDAGPPPARPADAVFRAIFDAASDMDISSASSASDGEDGSEGDQSEGDAPRAAAPTEGGAAARRPPTVADAAPAHAATSTHAADATPPPPSQTNRDAAADGGRAASRGRAAPPGGEARPRRRRRRSRSRSRSLGGGAATPEDGTGERQERSRSKHERRRQRRADAASDSEGDSDGDRSDRRRRRRKERKHRHRASRSRHKRSKK